METRRFAEFDLSTLMLGTVQFGMPYGVANRTGQPSYREILAILTAALEAGVNAFDTAAAYGDSEIMLGRALRELGVVDDVVVVTKVRPLTADDAANAARAALAIEQSVADSRQRLGIDCLPVVLFHREADAVHLDVLEALKARGWLRHAGVSCDNPPGAARRFAATPGVAAMQIPANILDPRHLRSGVLDVAAARQVAVFVRSVYLQGLLVMPEAEIPTSLRELVPVRRCLAALAGAAGITLAELAVRTILAQPGVTCVLTGVETAAQIRENATLFGRGPLPADLLAAIDLAVPALPAALITPSHWPTLAKADAKGPVPA